MSTLGKIVTVLVVVAAVFVGAMAAGYVQVSTDYRAALQNTQGALTEARGYNQALRAAVAQAQNEVAQAQLAGKQEAEGLRTQIVLLNKSIQDAQTATSQSNASLVDLKGDVAKLREEYNTLNARAEKLSADEKAAKTRADQFQEANASLAKALHDERTTRRELEARLMQAEQRVAELEKMSAAGSTVSTAVTPLPAVNLAGAVVKVDAGTNMAQINLGSSDGVVSQMTFLVQRGGRYVADLVVTKVDENTAIGYLKTVQAPVQEGDNVRYNVR